MRRHPLNQIDYIPDFRFLIERSASVFGDHPAFMERLRDGSTVAVSYARFARDVRALGTAFLESGLGDDRIALLGENSYGWVLTYFAIVCSGMTVVPLDKELDGDEMADQMARAGVRVICHTPLYASEAAAAAVAIAGHTAPAGEADDGNAPAKTDIRQIDMGSLAGGHLLEGWLDRGYKLLESGSSRYDAVKLDREATCSIVFTSGTTGKSKGVMLSHRCLAANTKSACELVRFESDDVLLSILPLHHTYEDMCGLFGPLYYGSTMAFCPGAKSLGAYLKTFSPTVMCLVPLYIEVFYDRIFRAAREKGEERKLRAAVRLVLALQRVGIDLGPKLLKEPRDVFGGRLRIVISGGAALQASYVEFYKALGVNILQGYGITECSPIIAANRNFENRFGSVGRVASCCEVRFDRDGQVLVRGDSVMNGYLDDPEGTAAAMEGGWFHTGDLGFMDRDGFLHLDGRCKDIIVLSDGENIMPQEIEQKLAVLPGIAEVVVMASDATSSAAKSGDAKSDAAKAGEADSLIACIYPDMGYMGAQDGWPGDAPSDEEARAAFIADVLRAQIQTANRKLPYRKRISGFMVHDGPFQKTTTMKVRRFLISSDKGAVIGV